MKANALLSPPLLEATTVTSPPDDDTPAAADAGTVTEMEVSAFDVMVAVAAPNFTRVTSLRLLPVMVAAPPPARVEAALS